MKRKISTDPNQRLYAIGDIHGRADLLARMLSMIVANARKHPDKDKKVIFLGDYIDRGFESRQVIDLLLMPLQEGLDPIFLRGNHDDYLMRFLNGDDEILPRWLTFGGQATLASYGVKMVAPGDGNKNDMLRKELKEKMPPEHKAFFKNTLTSAQFGDYFFVHAGAQPGVPLNEQSDEAKMFIRGEFLFSDYRFESIIIHGHTIKSEPEVKRNRIGIDTGAYATGVLTCVILDGTRYGFLSTQEKSRP